MAFKTVASLDADTSIALGGKDKNGKTNPTSIEGYFLGSKKVKSEMSQSGFASLHVFQTSKGNVGVWGKTKLDSALAQVTPGTMVKATFTGVGKPSKGRKGAYLYEVQFDEENTIEVASGPVASQNEEPSYDEDDSGPTNSFGADDDQDDEEYETEPVRKPAMASGPTAADRAAKVQALLNKRK